MQELPCFPSSIILFSSFVRSFVLCSQANDFDVLGLANVVFQDIQICIYDVDGKEQAEKLDKFFVFGDTADMTEHSIISASERSQRSAQNGSGSLAGPAHYRRQSSDVGDNLSSIIQNGKYHVDSKSRRGAVFGTDDGDLLSREKHSRNERHPLLP
jgi:hypothetical protein